MKKLALAILIAVFVLSFVAMPVSATGAYLSETQFKLLITEVCVSPSSDFAGGFGQLVEVYNNTDTVLDLYDYEMMFTSGRSVAKQFVGGSGQFKGISYITNQANTATLAPGEIGLIWIVYNETQKTYTEAAMRDALKDLGTPVADTLKVFRVDTTDSNYFIEGTENHLETDTRYVMLNDRGTYTANKGNDKLEAYVVGETTGRGAYVRVYGSNDGKSLLFGLPVNISNESVLNWQSDGKAAKNYVAPSWGYLVDNDNITQTAEIKNAIVHMPDIEPVVTTTEEPVVTTTEEPVVTTTEEPVVTTTEEPSVTTTEVPSVTTTEPSNTTTTAEPKSTAGSPSNTTVKKTDDEGGCGGVSVITVLLAGFVAFSTALIIKKH